MKTTVELAGSMEDVTSDTACMIPTAVKAKPVVLSQNYRAFIAMTTFSISIVFVNKYLLGAYPYVVSLSAAQFGFGWILLSFVAVSAPRPLSAHLVGTAITAVVCITNISLTLNSVGTYQLFRIAKLVAVIPFSYASLNHRHLASAALIGCGIVAAVAHDLTATSIGVLTASIGAVGSAWVGVYQKRVQAEMRVDYLAALLAFAPSQTILALVVARIADAPWTMSSSLTPAAGAGLLIVSVLLATALNASHQSVLSAVSPLAYQIGTQVPSIIIIAIGLAQENTVPSPLRVIGICAVTLAGALYSLEGACATHRYWRIVFWTTILITGGALLATFLKQASPQSILFPQIPVDNVWDETLDSYFAPYANKSLPPPPPSYDTRNEGSCTAVLYIHEGQLWLLGGPRTLHVWLISTLAGLLFAVPSSPTRGDVWLRLNACEYPTSTSLDELPTFGICAAPGYTFDIPVPGGNALPVLPGFPFETNPTHWVDRIPKVMWRGGTSCPGFNCANESRCLRVMFVTNAPKTDFDVHITSGNTCGAGIHDRGDEFYLSPEAQSAWRYNVDIPGNTCSMGLAGRILTGSLVFKLETSIYEQFYERVLGKTGLLIVSHSYNELISQTKSALSSSSNFTQEAQIGAAAATEAWARKFLSWEYRQLYWQEAIRRLAAVLEVRHITPNDVYSDAVRVEYSIEHGCVVDANAPVVQCMQSV